MSELSAVADVYHWRTPAFFPLPNHQAPPESRGSVASPSEPHESTDPPTITAGYSATSELATLGLHRELAWEPDVVDVK